MRTIKVLAIFLLIFTYGCGREYRDIVVNHPLPSNEIIFIRYKFGIHKPEIWAMDKDGKNQVKLGKKPSFVDSISWSPDRKKVAYRYNPKDAVCEIWIAEFGENKIKKTKILRNDRYIGGISWSPDGKKILFEMKDSKNNKEIYVIDSNGENLKRLTKLPNYANWDAFPCWSGDGKKIIFNRSIKNEGWKIYIMNNDGSNVERLTNNPSFIKERRPVWSPDGRWIAFEKENTKEEIGKRRGIILLNPRTRAQCEILSLSPPLISVGDMCFSPDSKKIAFEVETKNRESEIYTIDIDGKNLKNLTNTPDWDESSPSWRPIAKD